MQTVQNVILFAELYLTQMNFYAQDRIHYSTSMNFDMCDWTSISTVIIIIDLNFTIGTPEWTHLLEQSIF